MNEKSPKKQNILKNFLVIVVVLVIAIVAIIILMRDKSTDIEAYDPDNSYIITSDHINSKVADESEARELLSDFQLGDEYLLKETFDLNGGIVYHFQETYDGIPVHGRYSNVITSADTTAEGISSNYYPIHVDTSPKIDSDKALSICNQYLGQTNIEKGSVFFELCIYGYDETARLSYCICVGSNSIYIDANTGDIIHVYDNMKTLTCLLTSNLGEVEVNAQEHNGDYELLDVSRGGGIESCVLPDDAYGVFDFGEKGRVCVVISPSSVGDFRSSIDSYYNIERSYDYFASMHRFYSTDGNNNRKIHIINNINAYKNFNGNENIRSFSNNAAATTIFNEDGIAETWFIISRVNNAAEFLFSYYLDVMTHEYTHAVIFSVIGNSVNDQMGAMGEAYSDIMGECCEAYYNVESDWNIPGCRNISNIANGVNVGANINHMDYYSNDLDEHNASTVISSAAYHMFMGVNEEGESDSQYAIHSYEALSKLWFTSMFYLTPSSDFLTCRYAVESAATLMVKEGVINELQAQGISYAFDKVGIEGNAIEKYTDLMDASPDFKLLIKDRSDRDYEDCDMTISCIFKGHNYSGHNIGIQYRSEQNECIYNGSFNDYPQQKIDYEIGAIYSIDLKDQNSLFEESFIFEVKKTGSKELILHTSFLGGDFNPFKLEQSDNAMMQEDSDKQGGFVLSNPYPEGYQTNETAFDNLFSGHFANMSAPMGLEPGCTYESSKRFALKASYDMEDPINGAYYLMIADVLGNVYDMIPVSKYPREATGWLKDDIFYCSGGTSAYIMKQGGDITKNFFDNDISLIDVVNDSNGIMFFTAKTVLDSPYDSENSVSDTRYDIWDETGNIVLSFYKNELVNKYGIVSWLSTGSYHLVNHGSGIYHVSNRNRNNESSSAQYIFIDINRKKVFAVPVNGDAEYEDIESDGNYILIPHSRANSVTIFDIATEESDYIENVSEAYGLGEGKFFSDEYCYNIHGDILFAFENTNLKYRRIYAGEYRNGKALVIIDGGKYYQSDDHEYDIGIIDESGSDVNIITSLHDRSLYYSYVQTLDTYCIFTHEGRGGFLSDKNVFQEQSIFGSWGTDQYYGVKDNGSSYILRYGYINKDYSDEIRATEMYGYEYFEIN